MYSTVYISECMSCSYNVNVCLVHLLSRCVLFIYNNVLYQPGHYRHCTALTLNIQLELFPFNCAIKPVIPSSFHGSFSYTSSIYHQHIGLINQVSLQAYIFQLCRLVQTCRLAITNRYKSGKLRGSFLYRNSTLPRVVTEIVYFCTLLRTLTDNAAACVFFFKVL